MEKAINKTESDKKYSQSEKGKARTKRYNQGKNGIANRIRHQLTDTYLAKHLRLSYGMSLSDYYKLLDKQGGICIICKQLNRNGARLCVDHDHNTGRVRGLLCTQCNAILGYVNDNPLILKEAVKYLENRGENGKLRIP